MTFTLEQQAVTEASRNRKQLRRQFGLSFQAVEVVLKLANLRAFRKKRVSQAEVARLLGIDRSRVCQHLKKAEAVGLLVRLGPSYFFRFAAIKNAVSQAAIARRAATMKRQFIRKCQKLKAYSGFVADRATHTTEEYLEGVSGSRADNLKALAAMHIPLHLRKNRGAA